MLNRDTITTASRLFVRHDTHYEASVEVHPDHADQFRMSFPDALSDFAVVDVSKGGLGLHSNVYLPKNLRVILTIKSDAAAKTPLDRSVTVRAIVRRCTLLNHKPQYLIGLQFVDAADRDEQQLVKHAAAARQSESLAAAGGAHGP